MLSGKFDDETKSKINDWYFSDLPKYKILDWDIQYTMVEFVKILLQPILEGYRSGYNGAVLKTVCLKGHGSSNLPPSANIMLPSSIG